MIVAIIVAILIIILVITSLDHDYYYYFARLIYSIFLIPLYTIWDTPTYIRNFLYHEIISTPYIPDHITPFRLVIKSLSNRSTLI